MHRGGRPSVGVGDLSDLFSLPWQVDPRRVPAVWRDHAAAAFVAGEAHATYKTVYAIHVAIDCAFAILLATLIVLAARLLEARIANPGSLGLTAATAAVVYAVFDVAENLASAFVVFDDAGVGATIWFLSWGKWIAFAAAIVSLASLAAVGWRRDPGTRSGDFRHLVLRLRVHVLLVLIFVVTLTAHEQVVDVVRRLTPFQLVATVVSAAFFAVVVWVLSSELSTGAERWEWARYPGAILKGVVVLAVATAIVTGIMRALDVTWDVGWGLLVPAAFICLIWVLGKLLPTADPPADPPLPKFGQMAFPPVLAAAVFVGLGLGMFRAAFGEGVYTGELWSGGLVRGWHGQLQPLSLVVASVLLAFAALGVYLLLVLIQEALPSLAWRILVLGTLGAQLVVATLVWIDPWTMGETFGGVALLAIALAGAAFLVGFFVWLTDTCPLPKSYWHLRLRRAPVVLLLIAWLLVVDKLDGTGSHDVRIRPSTLAASAPTLDEAWACWLVKNGLPPRARPPRCGFGAEEFAHRSSPSGAVPLLFVATSGGATRAAYWTSTVLDCVLETSGTPECDDRVEGDDFRRSNTLFALSGISGGSVGFATYAARLVEKAKKETNDAWIDERLDRDFLSPTIAWGLFIEGPQTLLKFRHPVDRAEVLERSWQRAWKEGGVRGDLSVFQLWRKHHVVPLLLLNGTSVEDGCRFNGSVLDASIETIRAEQRRIHDCRSTGAFDDVPPGIDAPTVLEEVSPKSALAATRDLSDFLCDQKLDVRLSTAAILSARFPYVSPSGRLQWQCEPAEGEARKTTFVVDGGYLETSGSSPIVELSSKLLPLVARYNRRAPARFCVVPFMIQIDNGYESDAAAKAAKRPSELGVPGLTLVATRGAREANAKAAAGLLFDRALTGVRVNIGETRPTGAKVNLPELGELLSDRYAHFVIQSHAGPKAPLGWALSDTARDELRSQLGQAKNRGALREVRSWLKENALACSRP